MTLARLKQVVKKYLKDVYRKIQKVFLGYGKIDKNYKGVINLIDVGAIGNLPSPWFENSGVIKNVLAFEPNDNPKKTKGFYKLDTALWSKSESRSFYIYKQIDGSSLFQQNHEYVDANFEDLKKIGSPKMARTWKNRSKLVKTISMDCTTLDNAIASLEDKIDFHFIKIDAQGAEYEILSGANRFLKSDHCLGLHLELFNKPMYKGIKLFDEVNSLLEGYGFVLAKKFPPHGTFDSQNDCLFLKKDCKPELIQVYDFIKKVYAI